MILAVRYALYTTDSTEASFSTLGSLDRFPNASGRQKHNLAVKRSSFPHQTPRDREMAAREIKDAHRPLLKKVRQKIFP